MNPCVYIYSQRGFIFTLALYVDDISLHVKYLKVLGRTKQKLVSRFSMKGMGYVSFVLRMSVTYDRTKRTVTITQENYT